MPQIWIQKPYFQLNGLGWFHLQQNLQRDWTIYFHEMMSKSVWIEFSYTMGSVFGSIVLNVAKNQEHISILFAKEENKWVHLAHGFGPVCINNSAKLPHISYIQLTVHTKPHSIFHFNLGRCRMPMLLTIFHNSTLHTPHSTFNSAYENCMISVMENL